ncbi:MAG: Holliday junction branch migration protein RuvA [Clostridia bacterium]|nr:Holliday junction branch migration protein RuvA [Clostridia bacterium]
MVAFIEGNVAEKAAGELVLLAYGVGYRLICGANTVMTAPDMGGFMRVYTYMNVREDAMELFGFATREERAMFERLITVSGIGPRTALNILSSMPLTDLTTAIIFGDAQMLARAPGVGKKTAQRIALELKEKLSEADIPAASGGVPTAADAAADAALALQAWGYSASEARAAVNAVRSQSDDAGELIKLALRGISGGG